MRGNLETIAEIIVSIVLGFIPSFLIFFIFNQADFSLLRYKDFLLNFGASWISWISIIGIAIIIYLLLFSVQSKTKKISILIFALAIFAGVAILSLYGNFLLGNDVLVKLSADKEDIFFYDSPEQKVVFTMAISINPFCVAQCQYSFSDLGIEEPAEITELSITPLVPTSIEYSFNREGKIYGQELKRFEVICKSKKTNLCYTNEWESKRSALITINYDLSPEQASKNEKSKEEIISLERDFYLIKKSLDGADLKISEFNFFVTTEDIAPEFNSLSDELLQLNDSFEYLKQEWKVQNYPVFEEKLPILKNKTEELKLRENNFISEVNSNISLHNELAQKLNNSRNVLKQIILENISEASCIKLNNSIKDFNKIAEEFSNRTNLSSKESKVNEISSKIEEIDSSLEKENNSICTTSAIGEKIFPRLSLIETNYSLPEFEIEEPSPMCCLNGKCEKCCDKSCSNKNYPVLFLHGHSFNKEASADYSFDAFEKMKGKLAEEGYVDAGTITVGAPDDEEGLWGKTNAPIEVTGSYFFDFSRSETGEEIIIPSKTDSIDTYAIRLDTLVSILKHKTGKDKVIIVAHSMGGLVTRRYIQIFGEEDIEKIILISVPNQGIEGGVEDYCSLIGSEIECKEMSKGSLLIRKLGDAGNLSIPIHNIVGRGCNMNGVSGDGIAIESSQYLEQATNYYVEGTCGEFEFLHNKILEPEEYPQAYSFLNEALKKN